jgi:hypothetical protein
MSKMTADLMAGFMKDLRRAPERIAPEREQELKEKVYSGKSWSIRPCEGEAMFYALPGETKEVAVSTAGLASLWCLAHVATHLMDISSYAQRQERNGNQIDISAEYNSRHLDDYIEYARALFHADKPWPDVLQTPVSSAAVASLAGKVNNVFFGAAAWILLHEVGHLHLDHQKQSPAPMRIRDEHAADAFATRWILEKAGNGLSFEFRILMISVALAWVMLDATVKSNGSDHPAAITRFNEVTALYLVASPRSTALENSAYLFKVLFDPSGLLPKTIYEDSTEFFAAVSVRMNEIFPR